jgi:predicted Zn-dependent protease
MAVLPAFAQRKRAEPQPPEGSTDKELKIGKDAAREVEAHYKIIDDAATQQKLSEMVKTIGAMSERPKINYVVKIVGAPKESKNPEAEAKEVNAFTLPGGFIFVTQGLLDFVQSDHELAAVLAHEIAHNAKLHAMKQLAKAKKMQWLQIASFLGIIVGHNSESALDLAQFTQLVLVAIMNGYSVELEREADQRAIAYLSRTRYNPVGLLTFMERLHREEERRPQVELGIFRTHPPTEERASFALSELRKLNLPVNRRDVLKVARATAEPLKDTPLPAAQVKVGDVVVCKLSGKTEKEALQRAQDVAEQLEKLFDTDAKLLVLSTRREGDRHVILARGKTLMTVLEADVQLNNQSAEQLAQQWMTNVRHVRWREIVNGSA